MTSWNMEKLKQAITSSQEMYYRLLLVVGDSGSGKSEILSQLADIFDISVINLNMELSKALLLMTPKQRALRLPDILDQIADQTSNLLILDNLELIFDHDLRQNPLALLKKISRNRTIVASWNGTIVDEHLIYAENGHPEYKRYEVKDFLTITADNS